MLNHSDIDNTHEGWEAQKGIRYNQNQNENENQNENDGSTGSSQAKEKMNPLRRMLDTLGVTMEELRSGSRERRISDARTLLAAALPVTQKQAATLLNCSQAAVSAMRIRHKKMLETNKKYKDKWITILFL